MKNKIDPTDVAYPTHGYSSGMNIRTALAKDAMNGILAGRSTSILSANDMIDIVNDAVEIADRLIKKLNNE
jgi:hypothetical protein